MQKLTASDGQLNDHFGGMVSLDGDVAAIVGGGKAYVVRNTGPAFEEEAIVDMDPWKIDAAAIEGDTLVVGASIDCTEAVFVFERIDGVWTQSASLMVDGAFCDEYGTSLSISGDTIITGAPGEDDPIHNGGAAYVFEKIGGVWTQTAQLQDPEAVDNALFGATVAIVGTTAIVGEPTFYGGGTGLAFVYEKIGDTWSQIAQLQASDAADNTFFGRAVAIQGTTAIVGSPGDDDLGLNSGSAYIFERVGGDWTEVAKLTAFDPAENDWFGSSVSVYDDFAVVGSPRDDDLGDGSGSAYLFKNMNGAWTNVAKMTASDAYGDEWFGGAVAVSGETAIIGADTSWFRNGYGSAYVFDLNCGPYLQMAGDCPGVVSISCCGNTAGDMIGIVYGFRPGSTQVLPYCPGLYLDILQPRIAASGRADSNGCLEVRGPVPANACGRAMVQGVNVTQCRKTAVAGV